MKRNSQEISKQDFKHHNSVFDRVYYKPAALYPKPSTQLYILAYVATRELEKIEEKKFMDIGQIKPSPFKSTLKK